MFDPAVGLYVDGVYVANGQGAMATLLDIDSVEVLRGSQGTLFGRNNTGGSILLMSHRPELQQVSGEVALSGGNYDSFMGRAIVNLPLGSDFALRFAYQDNSRSGFGSSVGSGQDNLMNQHRYQARFGALWQSAAGTEFYFTYERFEAREYGAVLHPLTGPAPGTLVSQIGAAFAQVPVPGLPTVTFPADPYQTDGSFPAHDNATTDSLQLTASQKLGADTTVKLILGYRHLDANTALDVDATTLPLADTTLSNTSNQKSAEWQINDKAFGGHLDWVAGLYWFLDNGSAPSVQAPASPEFLAAVAQFDQITCPPQAPPGSCVPLTPLFSPVPVYNENSVRNRSTAGYLHGEYQLTPDWAVAAGVRRTDDLRELSENDYVVAPPAPGFPGGQSCTIGGAPPGPCPPVDESVSYHFWSWELSTRYRLSEGLNAYARIGRSQRSGGWNAPLATIQDTPFRPEQLTYYELGIKAQSGDRRYSVAFDVYYYDVSHQQLTAVGGQANQVKLINAEDTIGKGAELELHAAPVERLTLSLAGSYNYTRIEDPTLAVGPCSNWNFLPGGPACTEQNPLNANGFALVNGNPLPQAPKWTGDFSLRYGMPMGPTGELYLFTDMSYRSEMNFFLDKELEFTGPSLFQLGARIGYTWADSKYEVAVFCRNCTDQIRNIGGINFENFTGFINDPRIVGGQIMLRF